MIIFQIRYAVVFLLAASGIFGVFANDNAIQLGLRKVNLGTDLDGWTTVTQTKQIRYGEWQTSNGLGSVGAGGGWGNWGTSLVWEDYETVTSNEFERSSFFDGENGLVINSINPFVPSNATRYYQQELGSFIVSPRIDLSRGNQDHLFFQYRSNPDLKMEVWVSKNNENYLGIWEENPNRYLSHITTTNLGGSFTQVRINLETLLVEMGQLLIDNNFDDKVISPNADEFYIVLVAYDNANRNLGASQQKLEIKSIWTPSYYGQPQPIDGSVEPKINFERLTDRVTVFGRIGETYELQTSFDLNQWRVSHSFTLRTISETYPLSYFMEGDEKSMFFRVKHKP